MKYQKKKKKKKNAEETGDLIGNKTADKITKNLQQNNSETISNEHDKDMPKESYISPEERQKINDNLRLI